MVLQWVTIGCKGLHGVTTGYKRLQKVTRGYRGLQEITGGYRGSQEVTWGYKGVTRSYRGLQGVTGAYKRLQGVKRGYRGLHEVTGGYRGSFPESSLPQLRFLRKKVVVSSSHTCHFVAGALACSAGVYFGRANVLFANAHVETRKEGRK